MLVKQLIEALSQFPPEFPVYEFEQERSEVFPSTPPILVSLDETKKLVWDADAPKNAVLL